MNADNTKTVHGQVAKGFEPIRDAFASNIEQHEVGAAVCVYKHGTKVVDLWGGSFDAAGTAPYNSDTLQLVFSTTKGITAMCLAICVDRGLLDYDRPVADYWPEFAAAGKGAVTVAELVSHRAGLPFTEPAITIEDCLAWDPVCAALAKQAPMWEPGSAHGYHALTYGWLAGELVRRVDGRPIGQFVAEELAGPLGVEFWIGLPESQEQRVSPLIASPALAPEAKALADMFMGPETLGGKALSNNGAFGSLDSADSKFNSRAVHAAAIPAANGITNARSLAKLYAACIGDVDGVARRIAPATLDRATTTVTSGADRCLLIETTFGMGFMTSGPLTAMLGPGSFGHAGAGGSLAFGHPKRGIGFGYVMNQMDNNLAGDPRVLALLAALERCDD